MNSAKFPQANRLLASPSVLPEGKTCIGLWVCADGEMCISLWRPTWKERWSMLFFGKAWLAVLSGETQPPVHIDVRRKF